VTDSNISAVAFDLGGVLLRLNEARSTFGLDEDDSTFIQTWLMSPAVRMFECGKIDENQFASNVLDELPLRIGRQEFMRRFRAWPDCLYPGVASLLDHIPAETKTALLSNTNPVHWYSGDMREVLRSRLDHIFLSYETGHVKPDAAAFAQVVECFGCPPEEVLFLDDNPLNVDAASQFGLFAKLTRGIHEVRVALREARVLANTGE